MTGDRRPPAGRDDGAWAPPAPASDAGGLTLPGYRDLTLIAHGGESRVYRARQDGLDRDVAIKVVLVEDPATVARFKRELELTVALGRQHPNIVTVLATGTLGTGEPCIVMEFHELGSLHDRLTQHGPLPVSEVVAAGTVVADALSFAHAQGVLHRDVKPQNVLLLPTSYVLADFGIARFAGAGHTASAERFSYRHAAPQVLDGEPPAAADDVWSLGSTLYTLLDGRPPFASDDPDDDTALAYLRRVRSEAPRPLRRDDVPDELRDVLGRCLQRDREARFPDAASVHAALAAIRTEARAWAPAAASPDPAPSGSPAPSTPPASDAAPSTSPAPSPPPEPELPVADPTGPAPEVDPTPAVNRDGEVEPAPSPPRGPTPPVATSALAAATPVPAGPDEDATLGQPAAAPPPDTPTDEADGEPPRRGFDLRVIAFSVVALLIGIGLSVAVALRDRQPAESETVTPDPGQGAEVPVWEDELPRDDGPSVTTNDEALRAEVNVTDRGSALEVRWEDPTDGSALFVVSIVEPEEAEQRWSYNPGTTFAVLEGIDPDVPRYCVTVLAVVADSQGVSEPRCVDR